MKHAFLSTCLLFTAIASGHLCCQANAQDAPPRAEKPAENDDYLSKWENKLAKKESPNVSEQETRAVIREHQAKLLVGTRYENEDISAEGQGKIVYGSFDSSWHIMAIYSFKNDRARDLLFALATRPEEKPNPYLRDALASDALRYLPLHPSSGELLPKARTLLKELIAHEQKDFPDRAKHYINQKGEIIDPWKTAQYFSGAPTIEFPPQIIRTAQLIHRLEFNEKIPADERERFTAVQLEIEISYALAIKGTRPGIRIPPVTLPKDCEHFEIYLRIGRPPGSFRANSVLWDDSENERSWSPETLENPYWQRRKEFYERELANPRAAYSERDTEDIRKMVEAIAKLPKN